MSRQHCRLRCRLPAGRVSAYGQRHLGEYFWQPGKGGRFVGNRLSKRRHPGYQRQPDLAGIIAAAGGTMIVGKGGFPLLRGGPIEGACGVAGGTSQQDDDYARAAIERFYFPPS